MSLKVGLIITLLVSGLFPETQGKTCGGIFFICRNLLHTVQEYKVALKDQMQSLNEAVENKEGLKCPNSRCVVSHGCPNSRCVVSHGVMSKFQMCCKPRISKHRGYYRLK
ncbi:unnamed protein product, partial [Iphiclides podalirius]